MRALRVAASIFMLSVCALAHGQSSAKPVASSGEQRSFDALKTLAGTWKGSITNDNAAWATDQPIPLFIRVASSGNALIHELSTPGPEVTVVYLDSESPDVDALLRYRQQAAYGGSALSGWGDGGV